MTEEPISYYMPRDSCSKLFPKALTDAPITEIVSWGAIASKIWGANENSGCEGDCRTKGRRPARAVQGSPAGRCGCAGCRAYGA